MNDDPNSKRWTTPRRRIVAPIEPLPVKPPPARQARFGAGLLVWLALAAFIVLIVTLAARG